MYCNINEYPVTNNWIRRIGQKAAMKIADLHCAQSSFKFELWKLVQGSKANCPEVIKLVKNQRPLVSAHVNEEEREYQKEEPKRGEECAVEGSKGKKGGGQKKGSAQSE